MNKYAIFHKPESNYAYPIAPDTLTVVLRVARNDIFDSVEILYNNKYDFTKKRSSLEMRLCASDRLFSYYRADVTLPDARFAYIFRLTQMGNTYFYSEDGLAADYEFNCAYYTFFQYAFINQVDVMRVPDWANDAVFYQIFVDRFARGDFEKDASYINTDWYGKIDRYSFTGGDLDGIKSKLGYLKDAGFNAIYLTPIFLSESNHKYNITDYLTVDKRFGDRQKLVNLLSSAHSLGIKMIVDCVFNHCDRNHEYFKDVEKKGRASEYHDWFMIDGDFPSEQKGNYACFAYCRYMPKWNTNNPKVRRYLTDIALEYLGMGFDGLRLDVADEISREMWRQLRREVKEKYPQALIIGEIWHDNEHWLKGDQLDGVMNYKLQKIMVDYFGKSRIKAAVAADRMNALLMANCAQANAMALNFLDSHDTPRFFNFAGKNSDRLLCALLAVFMFPGMPCVFYGTEIPLEGEGDPDCRKTFDWTFKNQKEDYAESFKAVVGLKKQPALCGGEAEISAENGVLIITRRANGERVTAYFNTCGRAKKINGDGEVIFSLNFKDNMLLNNGTVVVKNKI